MKLASFVLSLASSLLLAACGSAPGLTFATPEEAVQRLTASAEDRAAADELLGAGGFSLLRSGDEVADHADVERVRELAKEKVAFEDVDEDTKLALLGNDGWELPIPLVRTGGRWHFDVEAGREEVVNRRVGRNELSTIETLRALVDAQREYAETGRDGRPAGYADRLASSEGKHDGLYWPVAEGEAESPLGPLVAEASQEGYRREESGPTPYHGYLYRVLTEQGAKAPGGARNYREASGCLAGFAFVAWPVSYGDSGVMTFVVNHRGLIFQKDLGDGTQAAVTAMKAYEPDESWMPVVD